MSNSSGHEDDLYRATFTVPAVSRRLVNLIFPYAVVSEDHGSPGIIVQRRKGADHILQVKANRRHFSPTSDAVLSATKERRVCDLYGRAGQELCFSGIASPGGAAGSKQSHAVVDISGKGMVVSSQVDLIKHYGARIILAAHAQNYPARNCFRLANVFAHPKGRQGLYHCRGLPAVSDIQAHGVCMDQGRQDQAGENRQESIFQS